MISDVCRRNQRDDLSTSGQTGTVKNKVRVCVEFCRGGGRREGRQPFALERKLIGDGSRALRGKGCTVALNTCVA